MASTIIADSVGKISFDEILVEHFGPPLSLILVRERGVPERINKNSLGVRVARGPSKTLSCSCCCRAGSRADLTQGEKMNRLWEGKGAGVDTRAALLKVVPHQTAGAAPPALCQIML